MRKLTILFVFVSVFLFSKKSNAQYTTHALVHAGYVYQNGSFGEVGAKVLFLKNDDFLYRMGGGVLLGNRNDKFAVIPKLQGDILFNTSSNVDIAHSYYLLLGADLSTKYIAPKLGISLFGVADIAAGYAFPFKSKKEFQPMEGLHLQVLFNIPTVAFQN